MRISKRTIGGLPYFYVARRYPNGATAKDVFERLQKVGHDAHGKLDLGVYRIVPHGQGEPTILAIVSLGRAGVEFAEKVMGGSPTDVITPEQFDALMARRTRVVAPIYASGEHPEGGQVIIRRGTRGAYLRSDGTLDERIGEG